MEKENCYTEELFNMELMGIREDDTNNGIELLPKLDFDDVSDPRLQRAMSVAMETQQITPLIKEELRLSILAKRLATGQEEINVNFPRPKSYDLTPAEIEKRKRRKEQNKMAARRHRQKSKCKTTNLEQDLQEQMEQKQRLEAEYAKLTQEKEELLANIISQHKGLSVSCDLCESQPIKVPASVLGTIRVESSVFTVIHWEESTRLAPPTSPVLTNDSP